MPVYILLNTAKQGPFSLGFHINARNVVGIKNIIYSLLDDQLILLMCQLPHSKLLLTLCLHDSFQKLLLLLKRPIQILQLFVIVLFKVVNFFFGFGSKVHINVLVKF